MRFVRTCNETLQGCFLRFLWKQTSVWVRDQRNFLFTWRESQRICVSCSYLRRNRSGGWLQNFCSHFTGIKFAVAPSERSRSPKTATSAQRLFRCNLEQMAKGVLSNFESSIKVVNITGTGFGNQWPCLDRRAMKASQRILTPSTYR